MKSFFTDGVSFSFGSVHLMPSEPFLVSASLRAGSRRVKEFLPFQSLDNLGSAEEVRSKRHSTSELGNITYSDVRREGWLHFKQILTEKGKVGTRLSAD